MLFRSDHFLSPRPKLFFRPLFWLVCSEWETGELVHHPGVPTVREGGWEHRRRRPIGARGHHSLFPSCPSLSVPSLSPVAKPGPSQSTPVLARSRGGVEIHFHPVLSTPVSHPQSESASSAPPSLSPYLLSLRGESLPQRWNASTLASLSPAPLLPRLAVPLFLSRAVRGPVSASRWLKVP